MLSRGLQASITVGLPNPERSIPAYASLQSMVVSSGHVIFGINLS